MNRISIIIGAALLAVLMNGVVFADESPKVSTEISFVASTLMEMQAGITWRSVLAKNVAASAGAAVSPVSVNVASDIAWTALPFLELSAAIKAGSGWNTALADGLRLNERSGLHDNELTGGAFSGLVWQVQSGGALQFDWAAIKPGDWNHIVFRSYHGINYRSNTGAGAGESWLYEADTGENRNGFNYYGNAFLGYRMPLPLDLIGFLAEADRYLYDSAGGTEWGDDLTRWKLATVFNAAFTDKISAAFLLQWQSVRTFTDETAGYGFYQDRRLSGAGARSVEFYRAVMSVLYKL